MAATRAVAWRPTGLPATLAQMTPIVTTVSDAVLDKAAGLLRAGQLVAFPTETVYGLGASALDGVAVARIYEAKGRPRFNPLIVHVADRAAAEALALFGDEARRLAEQFWPGPLTLVLPRHRDAPIADLVTAGLETIALRVPSHPVAQALMQRAGVPVAAPSANRSGHVSATRAEHVAVDLGERVAMILDGGSTSRGIESTIVAVTAGHVRLLRPGAIPREAIGACLGRSLEQPASVDQAIGRPIAPGQLRQHYAPRARVRLGATSVGPSEALLAFGPDPLPTTGPMINLSPNGDLVEAAARLFSALRDLDATGADAIAVMAVPEHGLGEAIADRLQRAAVRDA